MADPITVGMLVAGVLSLGGEAVKTAVGEVVKDAYKALKAKLAVWAAGDVAALESTPSSDARKAAIAEAREERLRGLVARVRLPGTAYRKRWQASIFASV